MTITLLFLLGASVAALVMLAVCKAYQAGREDERWAQSKRALLPALTCPECGYTDCDVSEDLKDTTEAAP